MATSKDVAELAGVSHNTVARAFSGKAKLKESTYKKVMDAADQLNYTPNYIASSLKQNKSNLIGLILPDSVNPFFMSIVHKLESEINTLGYRLLIAFDDYDETKQQRIVQTFRSYNTEILIFSPYSAEITKQQSKTKMLQLFKNQNDCLNSIVFDDVFGGYIGTKYLIEKGHKKILLCGDNVRKEGYLAALNESGIDPMFFCIENSDEDLVIDFLKNTINNKKPTAIFAVGNWFGSIIYNVLKQMQIKYPDDISLLVFDDLQWTEMLDISVIAHPIEDLTHSLIEKIKLLLDDHLENEKIIYKPFLINRSSVRNINHRK